MPANTDEQSDETQDPSNEEIARDLERVGKIVVEVQRGRVVKKVLLAGEEASDDAVTAGQTESSTQSVQSSICRDDRHGRFHNNRIGTSGVLNDHGYCRKARSTYRCTA